MKRLLALLVGVFLAAPLAAQSAPQCSFSGTSDADDVTSITLSTNRGDMSNFSVLVNGSPVTATVSQSGTSYQINLIGAEVDDGNELTLLFDTTGNWDEGGGEGWSWSWNQG